MRQVNGKSLYKSYIQCFVDGCLGVPGKRGLRWVALSPNAVLDDKKAGFRQANFLNIPASLVFYGTFAFRCSK